MDARDFTDIIIEHCEGGYYHPNMKNKLRNGSKMGNSGETMFGLDRTFGKPGVLTYWTPFWQIVDQWYSDKHNDIQYYQDKADGKNGIPAEVGEQLRQLCNSEMWRRFEYYLDRPLDNANTRVTSLEKEYIIDHPSILLNLLYAAWGGSERFETLIKEFQKAYSESQDEEKIWNALQHKRITIGNTQAADHLEVAKQYLIEEKVNFNWGAFALATIGVGIIYLIFKKRKK